MTLKNQPDGSDEIELQESGGGSSRRTSIASALGAGLPVVPPVVHLGSHGVSIEEVMWERMPRGPLAGAVVPVDPIDRPMHR